MANAKRPMEWVGGVTPVVAGGAADEDVAARLGLGLRDDEIAEIHKIIVTTQLVEDFDAAKIATISSFVSMDPDAVYSAVTTLTDLETIVFKTRGSRAVGIHVGVEELERQDDHDVYDFEPPVLVGTDLGIGFRIAVTVGVCDVGSSMQVRVFFTRRKASAQELNQILLKRR